MKHKLRQLLLSFIGAAWLLAPNTADARTLRWAGEADVASLDPYTRDETLQLALTGNIYEPLVRHTPGLDIEPSLATSWERIAPTRWRFHLRHGVTWQDGSSFTADDVLFSFARIRSPSSLLRSTVAMIRTATRVDDFTVDFETMSPDPLLPRELCTWYIMPKAWAEREGAEAPAQLKSKEENYATRHALGTGPYRLVAREPDRRTVLERNPEWWDAAARDVMPDRAEFSVIVASATRVAALVSGDVDLITHVPPLDASFVAGRPGLKLLRAPEMRTIFLGMDQGRDELLKSDVKGRNPFRDRRVREAVALAIDENAIASRVMRDMARPAWLLWAPGVNGYAAGLDHRPAPDSARARALLAEAGFPNGFKVGMDCPNDRYVMDEAICTAIVSMLARVGITVQLNVQPKARFFAEIGPPDFHTSFYLLGWTPPTYDALNVLFNLAGTRSNTRGLINFGGYSNPEVDSLIDRIGQAASAEERDQLIGEAAGVVQHDLAYIPLHQQVLLWGARDDVDVPLPADGFLHVNWVRFR